MKEVSCMHIISGEGIKMERNKIEAFEKIPKSLNVKELAFLGMLTYVFQMCQIQLLI